MISYLPVLPFVLGCVKYELTRKDLLNINLELVNPFIKSVSADTSNRLVLRVKVLDRSGKPVPYAKVDLSVESILDQNYENINNINNYINNDDNILGHFNKQSIRVDKNGQFLVEYIPPERIPDIKGKNSIYVNLKGALNRTKIFSTLKIQLVPAPVVYIHGYQENGTIFENLKEYLSEKGFPGILFNYESEEGIETGAEKLGITLAQLKDDFLQKGIQVNKFNLVTHSMGGLVARYYTSHNSYIINSNVGKIIFIAVPQKGSSLAALGFSYFQNKGIRDLSPDSTILSETLPNMINKGLNSTIQVGSIVSEFDEVVNLESASLREWGIKTYVFNIGENRISVDNLLNGTIIEAWNHKAILSNKKVFEMIYKMLTGYLPYPRTISP